jgi:putative endonuclease
MYYIYALRSLRNNKRYIGHTSKDVLLRLKEHNSNCNAWTRQNGPFEFLYSEAYQTKQEAIKREHFLKSGQGRKWLDENIKNKYIPA